MREEKSGGVVMVTPEGDMILRVQTHVGGEPFGQLEIKKFRLSKTIVEIIKAQPLNSF